MFERFTQNARQTMVLGQEEARLSNHNFIGTEHLLLALAHGKGVASNVLDVLGFDLGLARSYLPKGMDKVEISGSPPFTPRAKKVIEYALREALQLGHNYISTEHILLALVREGWNGSVWKGGESARILDGLSISGDTIRQTVMETLRAQPPKALPPLQLSVDEAEKCVKWLTSWWYASFMDGLDETHPCRLLIRVLEEQIAAAKRRADF